VTRALITGSIVSEMGLPFCFNGFQSLVRKNLDRLFDF
jgi:hypothetical protein